MPTPFERWDAVTSWLIFIPIAGAIGYYYWVGSNKKKRPAKARDHGQQQSQLRTQDESKKRRIKPARPQPSKQASQASTATATDGDADLGGKAAYERHQKQPQPSPERAASGDGNADDSEMSTKAFVERMTKAKEGTNLTAPVQNNRRVKTVKTGSAMASPMLSDVEPGAEADSELSPRLPGTGAAGDVSDMLEPKPAGPKSLRITGTDKAQKQREVKQKKDEVVETKKQRQNRKKREAEQAQRQADEAVRKVQENTQRRAAREARNEPAKDGSMFMATAPADNPWSERNAAAEAAVQTAPVVNGTPAPPLLDTFDAESTSSSNGALEASTAATSTTGPSEEEQMAQAMKQSEDESGWNTVSTKKQKKKADGYFSGDGDSTPVEAPKPAAKATSTAATKPAKEVPKGFMALEDEYKQRTDVDPNDASNWDA